MNTMLPITKKNQSALSSLLTDDVFGEFFAPLSKLKHQVFGPATNIVDGENEIQMHVVIPGISKENIKLEIDNRTLIVSYEKSNQSQIENDSYLRREFEFSNFSRSFIIPDNIDKTSIASKLENGVLIITLPKIKPTEAKTKIIEIQ